MTYEGEERRRMSSLDHDLLQRIDANLTIALEEIKILRGRVNNHDKFLYLGLGGIAMVELISKLFR